MTSISHWRGSPRSGTRGLLSFCVVAAAAGLVAVTSRGVAAAASHHLLAFAVFLALSAALMLLPVELSGRGSLSLAAVPVLASGFTFGVGAGLCAALCAAATEATRRRSGVREALLRALTLAAAAAAGAGAYRLLAHSGAPLRLLGPALLAGAAFWLVSLGAPRTLEAIAQGKARGRALRHASDGESRWLSLHYLGFGALALVCTIAYTRLGLVGLLAFTLPLGLLLVSVQRTTARARARVGEVELANEALRRSNTDLRDLFDFAAGLAAQKHDSHLVVDYAQRSLARLIGGRVEIGVGAECREHATALRAGGRVVGDLVVEGGDGERWQRLEEAIASQLATSLESATLAEEVRRTHLATIAALTRSLEAKDTYTGGHTERVSVLAVELARRLGYRGADLDAISIGALLHDVGKISIPEAILHKPGPLDNDEWTVMKRHPVVSEFILSGADLSPIVLQIARSSHERMDGRGYPDGLSGDEIPLPARIVLVADAFDALTTDRPYRRARRPRAAIAEIVANAGEQFCPLVVTAFERVYQQEPALVEGLGHKIVA